MELVSYRFYVVIITLSLGVQKSPLTVLDFGRLVQEIWQIEALTVPLVSSPYPCDTLHRFLHTTDKL